MCLCILSVHVLSVCSRRAVLGFTSSMKHVGDNPVDKVLFYRKDGRCARRYAPGMSRSEVSLRVCMYAASGAARTFTIRSSEISALLPSSFHEQLEITFDTSAQAAAELADRRASLSPRKRLRAQP